MARPTSFLSKTSYFSIFAVFLMALVFFNALLLFSQSIRLDESQSIWSATKGVAALLRYTAEDVNVPLYIFILHFWLQIFGTGIQAVRALSVIFFVATLPVLYKLAKETAGVNVAILTVCLFSVSPFVTWYSAEARTYTLFIFLATVSNLYFLRMVRSESKTGNFGYTVSTALGLYTHFFFVFLPVTQLAYALYRTLAQALREEAGGRSIWNLVGKYKDLPLNVLGATLIAGGLLLPWVIYFLSLGAAANTQPLIPQPSSFNIFQTLVNFVFGFQSYTVQSILISLWPLLILIMFFVFTRRQRFTPFLDYFVLASFLPILLVFIVSYLRPIFLSRYLIFVTPTLFFLIAWTLVNFPKRVYSYVTGGLLALMFVFLVFQNVSSATPVKEDYQDVSQYLSRKANPQDVIAVTPPFTVYPLEYSYTGSAKIVTIPDWGRYTRGPIPPFDRDVFIKQIDDLKALYANVFVVYSYDQGYEGDIKNYLDKNFQLLDYRAFSPGLEVKEYKLRYDIPQQSKP